MRRTNTALVALVLLALSCSVDDDRYAEVILDFSGLVPGSTYVVEMSGISIVGSVTTTPADAGVMTHIAEDSSELRLETAAHFGRDEAGSAVRIAFHSEPIRDVAMSLDFPTGADLKVHGIPWLVDAPDEAQPGSELPPSCLAEPTCSPNNTKCTPRTKCYLCGSFCSKQEWLCCLESPLPPSAC